MGSKKMSVKKRILIIFLCIVLFAGSMLGILQIGVVCTRDSFHPFVPNYEKINIKPLLEKEIRSEEDYQTLYQQTGLTKLGIDGLLKEKNYSRILQIQNFFFSRHEVISKHFAIFTYLEKINGYAPMALLEDGDIIVSSTTHVSWFRYGHSALVVDGKNERLLESFAPGDDSAITSASAFACLANFLVLRPKVNAETKSQVASYAKKNLVGIPYRMTTGIFSKKFPETLKGSQCAHIVWYSYKKFGIDLDSTGGAIVKPQDMANSPNVELVQAFGFNLETLWK